MAFIDLQKRYDTVPLIKLWEALNKSGISEGLTEGIKSLYLGAKARLKIGNRISPSFPIPKGLKQDWCLSPTLLNLLNEQALKKWKEKCRYMGVKFGDDYLFTLQLADD